MTDYRDTYSDDGIYGDFSYGSPAVSKSFINASHVAGGGAFTLARDAKILCIGAGNGYDITEFRRKGYECYGIELYIPDVEIVKENSVRGDASAMPFRDKQFDLVFCCETFEHIPEDICSKILAEVKRVADKFYFTIATQDDPPFCTHITIHPAWWWIEQFERTLHVVHAEMAQILPYVYDNHRITKIIYPEGVLIYGVCSLKGREISGESKGLLEADGEPSEPAQD